MLYNHQLDLNGIFGMLVSMVWYWYGIGNIIMAVTSLCYSTWHSVNGSIAVDCGLVILCLDNDG